MFRILVTLTLLSLVSCTIQVAVPGSVKIAQSQKERLIAPKVEAGELAELVSGNNAFALDLYQALREKEGNLFYSPFSISLALAMTYAGARGETERQMADTLHFTLPQNRLHPAFNALELELTQRGKATGEQAEKSEEGFQLHIANAIWGQEGYKFLPEFLDTLAENYGAGIRLLDFQKAPEKSRQVINDWVSKQTEGKIKDLIPKGLINELTRLVLTNAIYFNARWLHPFDKRQTRDGTFHLLDGSEVTVPMMRQTELLRYAEGDGYQAVELPYRMPGFSMLILLPEANRFEEFEASLNGELINAIVKSLDSKNVALTMPKFKFESSFLLAKTLAQMGMPDAFLLERADFSGMDGTRNLFIREVTHKAFVSVDEEGTEAAAATAVIVALKAVISPPIKVIVDHPFIFLIRDNETGTILFMGRVMNPSLK
ncbi:MAG: serpin family protein [Chloroflexi bacterium]|nr:MAG: serpin family protein [Chloroflexota bacterium]HDN78929.1 serpin family protein [Chloroflexota bacterium]